jgi:hypothetical protein
MMFRRRGRTMVIAEGHMLFMTGFMFVMPSCTLVPMGNLFFMGCGTFVTARGAFVTMAGRYAGFHFVMMRGLFRTSCRLFLVMRGAFVMAGFLLRMTAGILCLGLTSVSNAAQKGYCESQIFHYRLLCCRLLGCSTKAVLAPVEIHFLQLFCNAIYVGFFAFVKR